MPTADAAGVVCPWMEAVTCHADLIGEFRSFSTQSKSRTHSCPVCDSHYIPDVKSRIEVLSVTLPLILNDCTDPSLMSLYFLLFAKQSQEKYINNVGNNAPHQPLCSPQRSLKGYESVMDNKWMIKAAPPSHFQLINSHIIHVCVSTEPVSDKRNESLMMVLIQHIILLSSIAQLSHLFDRSRARFQSVYTFLITRYHREIVKHLNLSRKQHYQSVGSGAHSKCCSAPMCPLIVTWSLYCFLPSAYVQLFSCLSVLVSCLVLSLKGRKGACPVRMRNTITFHQAAPFIIASNLCATL